MKVDVVLSVQHVKQEDLHKKTVIVVDTLRATSTIITALQRGAQKVIPVETVGQALQYFGRENTVLIGERHSKKVNGFDYGNSPVELSQVDLTGQDVVITTTNGTKAFLKAKKAAMTLVGSLLNVSACLEYAYQLKKDILFICAGRRGEFALEDGLTVGKMIYDLQLWKDQLELGDLALFLRQPFCTKQEHDEMIKSLIYFGESGKRLAETAQLDDIQFCLQRDLYPIVGFYSGQEIRTVPTDNE
jgi:2-phosphosulfolactate phosphatase